MLRKKKPWAVILERKKALFSCQLSFDDTKLKTYKYLDKNKPRNTNKIKIKQNKSKV